MRDPETFEGSFISAVDRYLDGAPVDVDAVAVARATAAASRRPGLFRGPARPVALALLLGLLLALAVAAAALLGAHPWPSRSLTGGTIMFARADKDGAPATAFTIAPDGTGMREVLSSYDCCPFLSPDGTRVSVSARDADGKRHTTGIVNVDGIGYTAMLLPDPTLSLVAGAWDRDNVVAFAGSDDTDPSRIGIYVGDPANPGSIRQLTRNPGGNAVPVAFSPDGSRLAYIRGATPDAVVGDLFTVDLDGTHERQVSPAGSVVDNRADGGLTATWSPDGRRVGFVATLPHGYLPKVYVVDADGGNLAELFHSGGPIWGAHWSPDGRWIAFESPIDETAFPQVVLIHPDGTGLRTITPTKGGSGSWAPEWSPDGSRLLLLHSATPVWDQMDLWTANADGSDLVPLTHDPGLYTFPAWGP